MTKAALDIVGRLQGALLARAYVIPPRAAAAVAHLAGPPVVTKVYDATADVEACFFLRIMQCIIHIDPSINQLSFAGVCPADGEHG